MEEFSQEVVEDGHHAVEIIIFQKLGWKICILVVKYVTMVTMYFTL